MVQQTEENKKLFEAVDQFIKRNQAALAEVGAGDHFKILYKSLKRPTIPRFAQLVTFPEERFAPIIESLEKFLREKLPADASDDIESFIGLLRDRHAVEMQNQHAQQNSRIYYKSQYQSIVAMERFLADVPFIDKSKFIDHRYGIPTFINFLRAINRANEGHRPFGITWIKDSTTQLFIRPDDAFKFYKIAGRKLFINELGAEGAARKQFIEDFDKCWAAIEEERKHVNLGHLALAKKSTGNSRA